MTTLISYATENASILFLSTTFSVMQIQSRGEERHLVKLRLRYACSPDKESQRKQDNGSIAMQ